MDIIEAGIALESWLFRFRDRGQFTLGRYSDKTANVAGGLTKYPGIWGSLT